LIIQAMSTHGLPTINQIPSPQSLSTLGPLAPATLAVARFFNPLPFRVTAMVG
jgi:hypothetical protein